MDDLRLKTNWIKKRYVLRDLFGHARKLVVPPYNSQEIDECTCVGCAVCVSGVA